MTDESAPLAAWIAYLASPDAPADAMRPLELDGFLTGIIVSPDLILPNEWVHETWGEDDFAEGRMLYAAAFLTAQGLGVAPAGSAEALAGVSSVRSGALSIDFKDAGASASKDPAMNTLYGRLYLDLLRANRSGARVTDTGLIPTAGCNGIIRGW